MASDASSPVADQSAPTMPSRVSSDAKRATAPAADARNARSAATTASDGYIWMEAAGGRRLQICDGGDFFGTTLTATTSDLKKVAQRWMRQRRDWMRAA